MLVIPKQKRDERNRLHGDKRMRGVRSSALHAHQQAHAEAGKPKVWERDFEAAIQLRKYCEQADQER